MSGSLGPGSTTADVLAGVDLTGRSAVVTGATTGVGIETARALASAGAAVTLAARRAGPADRVASEIRETTGNPRVEVSALDLADLGSVAAFAERWRGPLHMLVNLAALPMLPHRTRTPRGWDAQFAVNVVGHAALCRALRPALAAARGARVVTSASRAHLYSPVVFDDLHFDFRPFDPAAAHAQAQTGAILSAVAIGHLWAADGITADAAGLGHAEIDRIPPSPSVGDDPATDASRTAATPVMLAVADGVEGPGYHESCARVAPVFRRPAEDVPGVAPYALDPDNAARLWRVAAELANGVPHL
ncbi:short subunit dehydrogenase [Stackebrandtia albiflava]|uniref:Short subunit dehydrogenase n=1 Tax=Stackebrandtia albiflava TaxID=406432 RepID=A0A562URN7_9ACTN|nr:SDR family NAD(P)-dependent oxidoreductase [Stackebrandtia albiflava]TWJ08285.1 short subunit dehydrogenase [Stackebrandtia albiflava]